MDKVLSLIRQADTAFYLTDGTALGRHYLHHRYSDDLDLFVNAAGDILSIARRFSFTWPNIFSEARQKDLWVEPLEISRMIEEFPVELLEAVKWVQTYDQGAFAADLKAMHRDIFHGLENSLKRYGSTSRQSLQTLEHREPVSTKNRLSQGGGVFSN